MKRLLTFPITPPEVCPDCTCNTVQTNREGQKYCSREKCGYRSTNTNITRTPFSIR